MLSRRLQQQHDAHLCVVSALCMLVGGPLGAIGNALLRGPSWLSRLGLTLACAGLGLLLLTAFLATWGKGEV